MDRSEISILLWSTTTWYMLTYSFQNQHSFFLSPKSCTLTKTSYCMASVVTYRTVLQLQARSGQAHTSRPHPDHEQNRSNMLVRLTIDAMNNRSHHSGVPNSGMLRSEHTVSSTRSCMLDGSSRSNAKQQLPRRALPKQYRWQILSMLLMAQTMTKHHLRCHCLYPMLDTCCACTRQPAARPVSQSLPQFQSTEASSSGVMPATA